MKTSYLALAFVVLAPLAAGCSAPTTDEPISATSEAELRSVARSFSTRTPLRGARMEALRTRLDGVEDSLSWARNQGAVVGLEWESNKRSLTATERATLAQAAFAFYAGRSRRLLRELTVVEATDDELGAALDAIGLATADDEPAIKTARAELESSLRAVARLPKVHVFRAELTHQPDMIWEGALVVVDEELRQIVIATGGYGT